ncbi:hypothetical protein KDA08_03800 [Candidatus Saccharibacteria bacterium]|nr:hypothetical protein [Candidatus Saccharibacteria bacterium]
MQIILSIIVGGLLVLGQSLWKFAIAGSMDSGKAGLLTTLKNPLGLLTQPLFLLGCVIYVIATVFYMYVISKYNYGVSYAMIVGCSTIFATTASTMIFHEKLNTINYVGVMVIILGIILVVKK